MQLVDLHGSDVFNRFDKYLCEQINKITSYRLTQNKSHAKSSMKTTKQLKTKSVTQNDNESDKLNKYFENIEEREHDMSDGSDEDILESDENYDEIVEKFVRIN